MATINNIYVFVETSDIKEDVESTSHPVEQGIDITDSVNVKPIEISLKGEIVQYGNMTADDIVSKLRTLKNSGSLIKYNDGEKTYTNFQIQSFNRNRSKDIWGGYSFDMSLKEVRVAKNSYTASTKKATKTATKTSTTGKIEKGSTVIFNGGKVYVSSDATKAAATRNKSTCKVTNINTRSWAKHIYHLQSKDGGNVCGWVDKSTVKGISTTVKETTSSGTQQVSKGSQKAVYHKVKKGECVYNLVTKNYKDLGKTCKWVIDNNPSAFSKKGDAKTLKVGAKLLMGYR